MIICTFFFQYLFTDYNFFCIYSEVLCQLTAPYASWIGFHNITLTWKALNQSDVVYIPQWTGPSLSGVWAQVKVDILNECISVIEA